MTALHLDDFTLAALALGDLPPALGADARRHLHGCAGCAGRFQGASREADAIGDPGEQALSPEARPAPRKLAEVARPDGGAVLLFPARAQGNRAAPGSSGIGKLAGRVFGRFEQLLHAAAGVAEHAADLEVAAGDAIHTFSGQPGETLEVWFGNPHPHAAWLTVLRQDAEARAAAIVCDGPRQLEAGRNAGDPTRLQLGESFEVVLAVLTRDPPPHRERLDEALSLGLFDVFEGHRPVGQVLCKLEPSRA